LAQLTGISTLPIVKIRGVDASDRESWDSYVCRHPEASLFHLFGWREIIHGTYGHKTYYLMAVCIESKTATGRGGNSSSFAENTVGILPLVHLKHVLFGNSLVSLPYVDGGGVLADSGEVEDSLLSEAIALARRLGAESIGLRCERAIAASDGMSDGSGMLARVVKRSSKVRMLLSLPGSSAELAKSFKSKLRSQINKPLKEGCTSSTGGLELLEDFYKVFAINMRDLGSPVHSKDLMRHVLEAFKDRSRILVVYHSGVPVASALVTGFNEVLRNPWASSDRKYASMSPNMLLYLRMLEFACDNGYKVFDFGRSTTGEGTYRFKEQWGAVAAPLHWYLISLNGKSLDPNASGMERYELAGRLWSKLPLVVTKVIGPRIRKHISL
jgi:serine/alanine adding enzyme